MGIPLPKPVLTQLQERYGNGIFRCGSSCVNGYRESMEDAHLALLQPSWGFFGVFDGHVNDRCSTYLEGAWRTAIEAEKDNIANLSDERLKEMALKIDQDWLDTNEDGGSTGTFFIARKHGDTVKLQVGNVGDSRVLACINGECKPMTEDHKPDNAEERARIVELGGRVESNRVDGSLAVSRAFGDRDYKQNDGNQLQQKVIALADVTHADLTFNSGDFAVLCCDGVFEGVFPNEQVIDFIKEQLQTCDDLAEIAGRVCETAMERGSRDNISCMIVQFKDGTDYAANPHLVVVPGPFSAPRNSNFRKVYEKMAIKGNTTVGAVLESRHDVLLAMEKRAAPEEEEFNLFKTEVKLEDAPSGAERTKRFTEFFEQLNEAQGNTLEHMERIQYLQQQVGVPLPLLLSLINDPQEQ